MHVQPLTVESWLFEDALTTSSLVVHLDINGGYCHQESLRHCCRWRYAGRVDTDLCALYSSAVKVLALYAKYSIDHSHLVAQRSVPTGPSHSIGPTPTVTASEGTTFTPFATPDRPLGSDRFPSSTPMNGLEICYRLPECRVQPHPRHEECPGLGYRLFVGPNRTCT